MSLKGLKETSITNVPTINISQCLERRTVGMFVNECIRFFFFIISKFSTVIVTDDKLLVVS